MRLCVDHREARCGRDRPAAAERSLRRPIRRGQRAEERILPAIHHRRRPVVAVAVRGRTVEAPPVDAVRVLGRGIRVGVAIAMAEVHDDVRAVHRRSNLRPGGFRRVRLHDRCSCRGGRVRDAVGAASVARGHAADRPDDDRHLGACGRDGRWAHRRQDAGADGGDEDGGEGEDTRSNGQWLLLDGDRSDRNHPTGTPPESLWRDGPLGRRTHRAMCPTGPPQLSPG